MKTKLTAEEKEARKIERREAKERAKEEARINAEKNQYPVKRMTLNIEWKKSATWGHNPNLTASVEFHNGRFETSPVFKCSGCGYDKESTVIADAFNYYLKYKLWGKSIEQLRRKDYKWKEENGAPYGIYGGDKNRFFDGGIGVNCYKHISEYIGGTFKNVASGKTFDVYEYTDNEI